MGDYLFKSSTGLVKGKITSEDRIFRRFGQHSTYSQQYDWPVLTSDPPLSSYAPDTNT